MQSRAHLFISGMVQGVFFRYTTKSEADELGLKGWVKNLIDGRVEVVIEGEKRDVEKLVAWCHVGPPGSIVRNVDCEWGDSTGEYSFFSIKY